MSKVLVLITTPDSGDEGGYSGDVIGAFSALLDGPYSNKKALEYVNSQLTDEDREEMEEGDELTPPKLTSPHPEDRKYKSYVDLWGVLYHFREIK